MQMQMKPWRRMNSLPGMKKGGLLTIGMQAMRAYIPMMRLKQVFLVVGIGTMMRLSIPMDTINLGTITACK